MSISILVANWKMQGTQAFVHQIAQQLCASPIATSQTPQVIVCPPTPYLMALHTLIQDSTLQLGAQDCAATPPGPYTGESAATMLLDVGCQSVIIGHSERRQHQHETRAVLQAKVEIALATGLQVIYCLGEVTRAKEQSTTIAELLDELAAIVPHAKGHDILFAYEPVWAIGTGQAATPEDVQCVHHELKRYLRQQGLQDCVLYGGSVKSTNVAALAALPDVDGFLVGGASLKADEFINIWQQVKR